MAWLRPAQFGRVVGVVFSLNMLLKVAFALSCYLAYGAATQQVCALVTR